MGTRTLLLIATAAFQASALVAPSAGAAPILTDPDVLAPGATVSPVPNGDSFDASDSLTPLFSTKEPFDFTGGPSGFLFEAVYSFPDQSAAHPYVRYPATQGTKYPSNSAEFQIVLIVERMVS
jgi:hypothetical protein